MTDKINLETKVYIKNDEENNFMELKAPPIIDWAPIAVNGGIAYSPKLKSVMSEYESKGILNNMERYIINENATVIFWKTGQKTIAKLDAEDKFDKEIGFMLACYKYMALYRNSKVYSKSEMKKELACIRNSKFYDFLFICFNKYTFNDVNKSKKFLEQLKVEKTKVKEKKVEVLELKSEAEILEESFKTLEKYNEEDLKKLKNGIDIVLKSRTKEVE